MLKKLEFFLKTLLCGINFNKNMTNGTGGNN